MYSLLLIAITSSDSSILPEELATQSVRLKEEQLRREEEKVHGPVLNGHRWKLKIMLGWIYSFARSKSRYNARSVRKDKSCWPRKSHSGRCYHGKF
jgi:hypothetical protein